MQKTSNQPDKGAKGKAHGGAAPVKASKSGAAASAKTATVANQMPQGTAHKIPSLSRAEALRILAATFDEVNEELVRAHSVKLRSFGYKKLGAAVGLAEAEHLSSQDTFVDIFAAQAQRVVNEAEMIDLIYGLLDHVEKKIEVIGKDIDKTNAKISGTA